MWSFENDWEWGLANLKARLDSLRGRLVPLRGWLDPLREKLGGQLDPLREKFLCVLIPQKLIIFIYICHDIAEILLKMSLNTKQSINQYLFTKVKLI